MVNDDWRIMNERMILGKDNSPLMNDKWVFSPMNGRMKEWLNDWMSWAIPKCYLMNYIDYKLYASKSTLVEILI